MITTTRDSVFVTHAAEFEEVVGDNPRLSLLAEIDAHEGPVYFADENALYFTTLPRPGVDRSPSVQIKRLSLDDPSEVVGARRGGERRQRDGVRPRRPSDRPRAGQSLGVGSDQPHQPSDR